MIKAIKRRRQKALKKAKLNQFGQDAKTNQLAKNVEMYLRAGNRRNAEKVCRGIANLSPQGVKIYKELGLSLCKEGRFEDSVFVFREILRHKPGWVELRVILGGMFTDHNRNEEAITELQKAISFNPAISKAHCYLGWALSKQKKLDEAVEAFSIALKNDPGDPMSHYGLGKILVTLGKLNEAEDCYKKAIQLNPDYCFAYRELTKVKRYIEYDDDISQMEKLYLRENISVEEKTQLAFGLGKVFEDLGNSDTALNYILEANQLKHGPQKYDIKKDRDYFTKLEEVFDPVLFKQHAMAGCKDAGPIFIVGMPRSGTSLVEQILASHPDVYGGGELHYIYEIVEKCSQEYTDAPYPENITQLPSFFEDMGLDYIAKIRRLSAETKFVVDKMPHNFLFIGMIKLILPNATIIHCRRDPLDVIWSIFKNDFDDAQLYTYDLVELGNYYELYFKLMEHWNRVLYGKIFSIHYEGLVSDPRRVVKKLLTHCGLEWHEDCLDFYKTKRAVSTVSMVQVRKPLYKSSVRLWKRYEKQLAPLVQKLTELGAL